MEELTAREKLFQPWIAYNAKNDVQKLKEFLQQFVETFIQFIDVDFNHLSDGFSEIGPHLTEMRDGLLEALGIHLSHCADVVASQRKTAHGSFDMDTLQLAEKILQCLIVLCRHPDNVHLVASCEFLNYIILISTVIVEQFCSRDADLDKSKLESFTVFIKLASHLCECLYDPHFVWRKRLQGWTVDKRRETYRAALLHNEVIPFFHECFQKTGLSNDIQISLLHMFGAVMCGSQTNALKAISPATLDVLLKVLSAGTMHEPTNTQHLESSLLKNLVLKCVVRMVHVIHECSPDQRQIEVREVMEGYMKVMLAIEADVEQDMTMQFSMINMINEMIGCSDKLSLQVLFVTGGMFDSFISLLQRTPLTGSNAQKMAVAVVKVTQTVLLGSSNAKILFQTKVGYQRFMEALRSLGQPSIELLETLLDLVVEDSHEGGDKLQVHNTHAAIMLLQWLPDIQSHELQVWLSEKLTNICSHGHRSRMSCCMEGMIGRIVTVLARQKQVSPKAVSHLITLLENLGTLSITAGELKQLISLFRLDEEGKQIPYTTRLMRAISTMARRDGKETALNFFDLQNPLDCISLPSIRKWPGPAFSFHAWICIDLEIEAESQNLFVHQTFRRQLYTFNDGSNNGLEAFVTPDYDFIVAVFNKKEYSTFTVTDTKLQDGLWHSVGVVHTAARRPFSQSQVQVYIDGKQKLTAPFKFPNLTEFFSTCRIGSPGPHYSAEVHPDCGGKLEDKKQSPLKKLFGSSQKMSSPVPIQGVTHLPAGTQDDYWGPPITLHGQVSTVCVFSDVVQAAQFRALACSGPNDVTVFKEDPDLADLPAKLVARYSAKAEKECVCADLSPYQNHGQFHGQKCVAWDIKDTINCVGGVQILFPLLEQVDPEAPVPTPAATPAARESFLPLDHTQGGDDWVVVPSSSYADSKLEQNQVAAFLTLLRSMLQTKPVNQDTFIRSNGAAVIGVLLQKVNAQLIDVNVLMAVQLLVEAMASSKILTMHLHQYILFDFRVWSKSSFPVRIGHIQYLSTIIKDDRKHFRKKYGVQFLLDVVRAYYSSSDDSGLSDEDSKTIRVSLLNLIKYYIIKDIAAEELNQLMSFILTVKHQDLVLEGLDLLLSLLESQGRKYDQLYLLLFEPEQAEMLYKLLTFRNFPIIFYEKVVKVLWLLLKSDRVYDKSKQRMRLSDIGHWGLVSMMGGYDISVPMIKRFMEQVSYVDTASSYNSILAVLSLTHECGLDIKLEASRQLLTILVSKPQASKGFAKQLGWQDTFVRLLTLGRHPSTVDNNTSTSTSVIVTHDTSFLDDSTSGTLPNGDISVSSSPMSNLLNRPRALEIPASEESLINYASDALVDLTPHTPMFERVQRLEILTLSEDDRSQSVSRSSSASIEDLSAIGQRIAVHRNSTTVPHSLSDSQMSFSESMSDFGSFADFDPKCLSVLQTETFQRTLENLGFQQAHMRDAMEHTEELCQNVLIAILSTLWKGYEGSDKTVWKVRLHHNSFSK